MIRFYFDMLQKIDVLSFAYNGHNHMAVELVTILEPIHNRNSGFEVNWGYYISLNIESFYDLDSFIEGVQNLIIGSFLIEDDNGEINTVIKHLKKMKPDELYDKKFWEGIVLILERNYVPKLE